MIHSSERSYGINFSRVPANKLQTTVSISVCKLLLCTTQMKRAQYITASPSEDHCQKLQSHACDCPGVEAWAF